MLASLCHLHCCFKLLNFGAAMMDFRSRIAITFALLLQGFSRLGAALAFLDRHDEAISAYKKGLEIDPANATLRSGLQESRSALAKS